MNSIQVGRKHYRLVLGQLILRTFTNMKCSKIGALSSVYVQVPMGKYWHNDLDLWFLWFFIARFGFLPSFFQFHLVRVQFHVLLLLKNAIDDGAQKPVEILHPGHLPAQNNIVAFIKN